MDSLPDLMRAAVLSEPGGGLEAEHVRTPVPEPGEMLVSVTACDVCHTDLHVLKGEVGFPTPAVLGHEISGVIAGLGDGVPDRLGLELGTQVVGAFVMPCGDRWPWCRRGIRGARQFGHVRAGHPDGPGRRTHGRRGHRRRCRDRRRGDHPADASQPACHRILWRAYAYRPTHRHRPGPARVLNPADTVTREYSLFEAGAAYAALAGDEISGRAVVRI